MAFAATVIVLTSFFTGYRYYTNTIDEYEKLVYGYLRAASQVIDGEKTKKYVETGKTDVYYDEVLRYLTATRDETDINLFYVFVPYEDDLVYVWQTADNAYEWLGYRENYMDGGKETRDNTFRKDPLQTITFYNDPTYGNIACGFYPIFDKKGEPVALIGMDLKVPDIRRNVMAYVVTISIGIIAVTVVAGIMFFLLLRRGLVNPIRALNVASKGMIAGLETGERVEMNIHTGDEIEELADSFTKMEHDIHEYIDQLSTVTAERERIGAELNLATKIQANMLPDIFPAFPERHEIDIYASMDPAKEVGGDFYDFFFVDETHLALVIADVSDKGVPAALFMMISKIMIQNFSMLFKSPSRILTEVNEQILKSNRENMFVTVWMGILDVTTGKIICSNAGHEYPMLTQNGGGFELLEDDPHGLAIGLMPGMTYTDYEITLSKGDRIFVYTDGIPEATSVEGELFGMDRTVDVLNANRNASAKDTLAAVKEAAMTHMTGAPQFDDMTMLCVEYKG